MKSFFLVPVSWLCLPSEGPLRQIVWICVKYFNDLYASYALCLGVFFF